MKKVILSLVVVAALSTASCKKNYTCTCTVVYSGAFAGQPNTVTTVTIDNTKSKATTACNGLVVSTAGATETCSLN